MDHKQRSDSTECDHIVNIRRDLVGEISKGYEYTQALSNDLRMRLESLPPHIRKKVVNTKNDDNTPLMLACKYTNVGVIEYLIKVCDADIEQAWKSIWDRFEKERNFSTQFDSADASRDLLVVKCLVRLGANVNVVWENGKTPLNISCSTRYFELAKFLVENGADLEQRKCLLLAVRSAPLCEFLLNKGADVNARDEQGRTALHLAVRDCNLDTIRVLLDHGVDPFLEDDYRTDALRMACFLRKVQIAKYLMDHINYTTERLANTHELLGAILIDYSDEMTETIEHWWIAQRLRSSEDNYIQKQPMILPRSAFGNTVEFSSDDELAEIILNEDSMMLQSCVILERQLGIDHWITLKSLHHKAKFYENIPHYERYMGIVILKMQQHLRHDIFFDAHAYTYILLTVMVIVELFSAIQLNVPDADYTPPFEDVLVASRTLVKVIIESRHVIEEPDSDLELEVHLEEAEQFDFIIECFAYLIHVLRCTAESEEHFSSLRSVVGDLIHKDVRNTSKETLLHLCVSKLQTVEKRFFPENENTLNIFPQLEVTRLLLECGANVNARDKNKSTPLLIASLPLNYDSEIIRTLIEYGAHLDLPNKSGQTAWNLIQENSSNDIVLANHVSLQCMCANAIVKYNICYQDNLPHTMQEFVRAHEPY